MPAGQANSKSHSKASDRIWSRDLGLIAEKGMDLSLLRVNNQVYREAADVLFSSNTFVHDTARGTKRSRADFEKDNVSMAKGDRDCQPEPPAEKRVTKSYTDLTLITHCYGVRSVPCHLQI